MWCSRTDKGNSNRYLTITEQYLISSSRMADQQSKGKEKTEPLFEKDWLWSVQPLLTWFRYLGVDLLHADQENSCPCFLIYRLFCLLLSIGNQVFCLCYVYNNVKNVSDKFISDKGFNSDTFTWNSSIDYVNYAFHSIGCHLVLLCVVRTRFSSLVTSFQRLESFLNRDVVDAIRKICILAIFYVIIVVRCSTQAIQYF